MPLFGAEPRMRDRFGDCSANFCCNQRLINVSTCTPRSRAWCSTADSSSHSMGTAQAICNATSGVARLSKSVKSWLSQNSPIFSKVSACEMLLTFLTPIGSPCLRAHVTGTDDDGGCRVGFVHKKHYDIASTEGLAESGIDLVVCTMLFLSKADTRLTEQNLASFSHGHVVLRGNFVGNTVRTNM